MVTNRIKGKSVFARGLLRRWLRDPQLVGTHGWRRLILLWFGFNGGSVPSPTYAIMHAYRKGNYTINHLDLYRIASLKEVTSTATGAPFLIFSPMQLDALDLPRLVSAGQR